MIPAGGLLSGLPLLRSRGIKTVLPGGPSLPGGLRGSSLLGGLPKDLLGGLPKDLLGGLPENLLGGLIESSLLGGLPKEVVGAIG